jgi:hypothetical protein
MRLTGTKISLAIVLSIALIATLPLLSRQAQARGFGGGGFGGFHGGGGFGGGFGGGGFGGAGRGFGGVGGPGHGWGGVGGPGYAHVDVTHNVNVVGGWGHYGAGAVAAGAVAGAVAGLAIGATIASLPAAAQPLDVGGQTYYYDGTNYYQPCAQGSDMNYCVVSDPN